MIALRRPLRAKLPIASLAARQINSFYTASADSGPLSPHVPGQVDFLSNGHVDFMKVIPPSDLY